MRNQRFIPSRPLSWMLTLMFMGALHSVRAAEFRPFATISYLSWEETVDGDRLVSEDGPLWGAGIQLRHDLSTAMILDAKLELFGGLVNYDGAVFDADGTSEPYDGETGYLGVSGDATLIFPVLPASAKASAQPALGIGFHRWVRELDQGGDYGYDETWTTIYLRGGLEAIVFNDYADWYGQAFLILPLSNDEDVDNLGLVGANAISLEPEKEPGLSLVIGRRNDRWDLALTLDYLHFGESDLDASGLFFQPESEWLRLGARAGFSF